MFFSNSIEMISVYIQKPIRELSSNLVIRNLDWNIQVTVFSTVAAGNTQSILICSQSGPLRLFCHSLKQIFLLFLSLHEFIIILKFKVEFSLLPYSHNQKRENFFFTPAQSFSKSGSSPFALD